MAVPESALSPLPDQFHLTPAQRKFVQCLTEDPEAPADALCQRAGVSVRSYYGWCQDRQFRALVTTIWSQAFLFNAWQVVNHAAEMFDKSPSYARFLFQLLFDPKGQAALASWQVLVSGITPSDPDAPTPAPARVARHLQKITAQAVSINLPAVQMPSQQNQPLASENCINSELQRDPSPVPDSPPSTGDSLLQRVNAAIAPGRKLPR